MRNTAIIRKAVYALGLFLLPAPLFLLAGAGMGVGLALLLPLAAALALGLLTSCLKPRLRLPAVALGAALCVGLAWLLTRETPDRGWRTAGLVLTLAAALWYPKDARRMLEGAATSILWVSGLGVTAFVWIVGAVAPVPRAVAMMERYVWIYCVYMVFALNMDSLVQGVGLEKAPSRAMVLRNLAGSLIWAGLFLLVTHIPELLQAFRACVNAVIRAVVWLMEMLNSLLADTGGQGGVSDEGFGPGLATGETSWLMRALQTLLHVIAIVLVAAVVLLLLREILQALRELGRKLIRRLREYMDAVGESYEDQVESLLDWGEVKRAIRERRGTRRQAREERIPWDRLAPREQVRRSYRDYLSRHPEIGPQRTARQTLADPHQADIYEAARYSSREITPEEAQSVRSIGE